LVSLVSLVVFFFELDFFFAFKKLSASSKEKALLSALFSSFCDLPNVWVTISLTLLIRLDTFFSAGALLVETFFTLGLAEDDFTSVLTLAFVGDLGLLADVVTFFGTAFLTTFSLALTGVLFLATVATLVSFLAAVDVLVARGLSDFALLEGVAFFLAVMCENFRRI